jgi:alkylation response protein AidB-like acyl-CoA dehydrogenase
VSGPKRAEDRRFCLDPICARPLLMQRIAELEAELEAARATAWGLERVIAEQARALKDQKP